MTGSRDGRDKRNARPNGGTGSSRSVLPRRGNKRANIKVGSRYSKKVSNSTLSSTGDRYRRPRNNSGAGPSAGRPHSSNNRSNRINYNKSFIDRFEENAFGGADISSRPSVIIAIFLALAAIILIRLALLQIFDVFGYQDYATSRRTAEETIFAKRGTIYDRNGNILAMSVEAATVCCDPRQVENPQATAEELAKLLGGNKEDYIEALSKDSGFSYVKRQADASVIDTMKARKQELRKATSSTTSSTSSTSTSSSSSTTSSSQVPQTVLDGVYCIEDTKRVYPYGSVAGQILGSVNVDGEGVSGLELEYDDILKGTNGSKSTERGRTGMDIPGGSVVHEEAVDGQDIMISIDVELQAVAEETLAQEVQSSNANSGNLTVIDGNTGEIYADCSTPLFDPNNRANAEEGAQSLKSVSTTYEPGSIFKPVTAAILLDEGLATSDETITVPGSLDYGQWTITDAHEHGTQQMTFKEIIEQSSNIGISLLEERVGTENFYNHLVEYGFGKATGLDYPGELDGRLKHYSSWSEVQEANISFGQGVTVTTTQMASFYGVIASGGKYVKPHFLIGYPSTGETITYDSKQLITSSTCAVLDDMLSGVVEDGTGTLAAIEGYTVAGKTGTSQKINDDGTYSQDAYIISFDGYLPNTNSSLACAVSVDNPAASSAMPVFSNVMRTASEMYRITSY